MLIVRDKGIKMGTMKSYYCNW